MEKVMSNTMRTEPMRSARPAIAAALLAGIGFAATATAVSADSFLEGKSNGMRKCVNAILGGYEVKGVNVHGHHFNCKPMSRSSSDGVNYRQIVLSHDQFGRDDQYLVNFRVDSLNVLLSDSVTVSTIKGVSLETLKSKAKYLHTLSLINRAFFGILNSMGRPPHWSPMRASPGAPGRFNPARLTNGNPQRRRYSPSRSPSTAIRKTVALRRRR